MNVPIPYIIKRVRLSWREILWGYRRKLITESDIVEYAIFMVMSGFNQGDALADAELELASLMKSEYYEIDRLLFLLKDLTPDENNGDEMSPDPPDKWVYLLFSWLYDNKDQFADPLVQYDTLYDSLNYPEIARKSVGYMPGLSDDLTTEQRVERRYQFWRKFLEAERVRWEPGTESPGRES